MALQIEWTKNALADYEQVIDYLLKAWSVKVAADFIDNVEQINSLSKFPKPWDCINLKIL